MIYLETPQGFTEWTGQPINDILHPRSIEQYWSADELEAIGLWRNDMIASADPVPEGKISTGQTVQRVNGAVMFVHQLADAPEPEPAPLADLKPYQFWAVMRATGHEAGLRAWVASLNDPENEAYDPLAWANASAIIDFSLEYRRDHPLVGAAQQVMGVTVSELDDLWRYAATL